MKSKFPMKIVEYLVRFTLAEIQSRLINLWEANVPENMKSRGQP